MNDEETYCDCEQPSGFMYLTYVTVCNICLTQFPYYDCYCELKHDDCTLARRERNIAYRARERNNRW